MSLQKWITLNSDAYKKWQKDPVTRAIVDGLKEIRQCHELPEPSGDRALQAYGVSVGHDRFMNILEHLDDYINAEGEIDFDYGRQKYLMEVEGMSENDAKELIEKG